MMIFSPPLCGNSHRKSEDEVCQGVPCLEFFCVKSPGGTDCSRDQSAPSEVSGQTLIIYKNSCQVSQEEAPQHGLLL